MKRTWKQLPGLIIETAHVFGVGTYMYPLFLWISILPCNSSRNMMCPPYCFSVFAVSASLLTACNSPSIHPLHHCQVIACSTGEAGERCRMQTKWTVNDSLFLKAVIHHSLFEKPKVKKRNMLRRKGNKSRGVWAENRRQNEKKKERKGQLWYQET